MERYHDSKAFMMSKSHGSSRAPASATSSTKKYISSSFARPLTTTASSSESTRRANLRSPERSNGNNSHSRRESEFINRGNVGTPYNFKHLAPPTISLSQSSSSSSSAKNMPLSLKKEIKQENELKPNAQSLSSHSCPKIFTNKITCPCKRDHNTPSTNDPQQRPKRPNHISTMESDSDNNSDFQIPALKVYIENKSFLGILDTCSQFTLAGKPLVEHLLSCKDVSTKPTPYPVAKMLCSSDAIIKREEALLEIKWCKGVINQNVIYMPDIQHDIVLGRDFMKNTTMVLRLSEGGWSFDKYIRKIYPFDKAPDMNMNDRNAPLSLELYQPQLQIKQEPPNSPASSSSGHSFDTTYTHANKISIRRLASVSTDELTSRTSSAGGIDDDDYYSSDATTIPISSPNNIQNQVFKFEIYKNEEIQQLEEKERLAQELKNGYKSKNLSSKSSTNNSSTGPTNHGLTTLQNKKETLKQRAQAILDEINHIYDLLEIVNDNGNGNGNSSSLDKASELNQFVRKLFQMYHGVKRELNSLE